MAMLAIGGAVVALAGAVLLAWRFSPAHSAPKQVRAVQPLFHAIRDLGGSVHVDVRMFGDTRGVIAIEPVEQDTTLIWLPEELLMVPSKTLSAEFSVEVEKVIKKVVKQTKAKKSGETSIRNFIQLVLGLARVKAKRSPALLSAYVDALPEAPKLFDSFTFHQRAVLELLLKEPQRQGVGDSFYNMTIYILKEILDGEKAKTVWFNETGTPTPEEPVLRETLRYVVSRAVSIPSGDLAIAPAIDLVNLAPSRGGNVKLECVSDQSVLAGCSIIATRDIAAGEQLTIRGEAESDAYRLATSGISLGEPISAFRLIPAMNSSSAAPKFCWEKLLFGITLDERYPHGFRSEDLGCVLVGNFSTEELQSAREAGFFRKDGGSAVDLAFKRPRKGTKQARWRILEDQAAEVLHKICKKHRQRLHQETYKIGRLGSDAAGEIISKQLRLDIKLLRGCEAFMTKIMEA